jgi:transcriptional regulator with XRE-family HTH domain
MNEDIRELLLMKLKESRVRNPRYSLRSFSKKIGVSPATLSGYLSEKRNLSEKAKRKILDNLKKEEPSRLTEATI